MSYPAKHISLNNANYFYYTNSLHKHGFYNITHYKKILLLRVLLLKFNYLWIYHLLMIVK